MNYYNLISIMPKLDADAQAFITATGISGTNANAINKLVLDLKAAGLWNKMKAVYPMVGGTATAHKFNLKNPADTNAAFRLQFFGGWTHSTNGALPNGSTGYADTKLSPTSNLSLNSLHLSSYIGNASQGVLLGLDTNSRLWISPNFNNNQKYLELNTGNFTSPSSTISNNTGLWIGSRTNSTTSKLFNNGILNYTTSALSTSLDSVTIYLASRNISNVASNYSSSQIRFSSIGDGLTDAEALTFYNAVNTFQTTLGRNV